MSSLDDEIKARQEAAMSNRLRPEAAAALFRVTRVTLYNWMNDPETKFPKPKRFNRRHVFWYEFDLRQWAEENGYDLTPHH